uniref:PNPLA domain-containing protein n=1 Tax=Branchiostoma floridae TaxID=7739 RepID=C3YVZ9_BRAFL|eukprot:XP_002599441.1 hypothetical protein BRAFLDRAFT_122765 [Branchiostoma floridae]
MAGSQILAETRKIICPAVKAVCPEEVRMGNTYSQEVEKKRLQVSEVDHPQDKEFGNYDFPFENLVIEGGGARGVAYVGALRVLESAGILQNIKRVAGVSAGAITATFVALGLSCADVAQQAEVDMGKILISGGYLQTLIKPLNLYRRYGWETGDGFLAFFGGILEKFTRKDGKPGNPDVTFKQLYNMSGIELCIVVTNLDQMTEEYCHVKTTPNLPIRKAVRMSMSIPGLFEPVLTDYHGSKEFYVDGGVICNYPLHSFDGWWLSMKEEDSFFSRLDDLAHLSKSMHRSNRFEPVNTKTIGLMLYSDDDIEQHQQVLSDRLTQEERLYEKKRPDTEAARAYEDKRTVETVKAMENRKKIRDLIDKLLTSLKAQNIEDTSTISREELHRAFAEAGDDSLTKNEKKQLFGEAYAHNVDQLFDQMDANKDGKVDDMERTIGVDSDYVKTTDFQLEDEDKMFLFKRGATGARAFLRTYIAKNDLKPARTVAKRRWKSLQRCVLFSPRVKKVPEKESPSANGVPIPESETPSTNGVLEQQSPSTNGVPKPESPSTNGI